MEAKKRTTPAQNRAEERPPTASLVVLAWFPVPGLAAMNLLMMAAGFQDVLGDHLSADLRHIVWAHLSFQMLIGAGVTGAIVRRLNLEDARNQVETTNAIRRDHVTGWCLQALAALCFCAYVLINQ